MKMSKRWETIMGNTMENEWEVNLEMKMVFNGRANGFYNGNEFGKRFDYNEKTSLIFNNEHTK